jgi:hypothetical protein
MSHLRSSPILQCFLASVVLSILSVPVSAPPVSALRWLEPLRSHLVSPRKPTPVPPFHIHPNRSRVAQRLSAKKQDGAHSPLWSASDGWRRRGVQSEQSARLSRRLVTLEMWLSCSPFSTILHYTTSLPLASCPLGNLVESGCGSVAVAAVPCCPPYGALAP